MYVTSFPSGQGKWQISTEGGTELCWNPKGRELFWRKGDKLLSAAVEGKTTLMVGRPRVLFSGFMHGYPGLPLYDVSRDGQRLLMLKESEAESAPSQLNVVLNLFEGPLNLTGGK